MRSNAPAPDARSGHAHDADSVAPTDAPVAPRMREGAERIARMIERLGLTPHLVWAALALFIGSRLALLAITALALAHTHTGVTPGTLLRVWFRYDATMYANIAHSGYSRAFLYRTAFFPLEPLLAWIAAPLTGGDTAISAMLVSNLAFLGALLGMAALARHDQDDGAAVRAMLLLTFYPLAFFTFAGYSESAFLFCVTWALLAIRRRWWVAAYVLGIFAGLARQVGQLLVAPYALTHYTLAHGKLRNLKSSALGILGPPLGLALFGVALWQTVGDPLSWEHVETLWHRAFAPPWVGFARTISFTLHSPDAVLVRRAVIEMGLALLFAALIGLGARRLPAGETLYAAAAWLVAVSFPDTTYGLVSLGRMLLPIVPCFLTLALLTRRRWAFALTLGVFVVCFMYLAQSFVRGHPII